MKANHDSEGAKRQDALTVSRLRKDVFSSNELEEVGMFGLSLQSAHKVLFDVDRSARQQKTGMFFLS